MREEIVDGVSVDGVEAWRRPCLAGCVFGMDVLEKILHCELEQGEKRRVQLHSD